MEALTCPWDPSKFLIFSDNVPSLLYYSHLPGMLVALIVAVLIFRKSKEDLGSKILLGLSGLFIVWAFVDLILWATNNPPIVMFWWSMQVLIEPFIYIASLYLIKVMIDKKSFGFGPTLLIFIFLLPLVLGLSTDHNLSGVYQADCVAIEGNLAVHYVYLLETILSIWIALFIVRRFQQTPISNKEKRHEILAVGSGIVLFLLAFSYGNIIGSITLDWEAAQYGLLGMPVFIGLLAYSIVRFKTFDVKVVGANALVVTLWILILSLLFLENIIAARTIIIITLLLSVSFGVLLMRSVRREVRQREEIEQLATSLEKANQHLKVLDKQKSEFVSLASHQLRGPITSVKGYISMILEGDFGDVNEKIKERLGRVQTSLNDLVLLVSDYLDVTRIELGKMKYRFETIDLSDVVREVEKELKPTIDSSGLEFNLSINNENKYKISADRNKIKQVIINLIDNAIKYTDKGFIKVDLDRPDSKNLRLSIKDSGIGISVENQKELFGKFIRTDNANDQNVNGTGLGLYIARKIVEEHNGKINVKSGGVGKGSEFSIELPFIN